VCLASQGALAALLIADAAEIWTVALFAGITGGATGFFNPAAIGMLPTIVQPEDLQRANGLRATAMAVGEIAGPLVAGLLVVAASPGWALAIDAATFGVSAAFLSALRIPARPTGETEGFWRELRDGWSAFRARTWVWAFVASAALGNMLWGAWSVLGPVVADEHLGGAAAWGGVLAAMGVGGLIGALLAIRAEPARPMVLTVATGIVFAVPLALLAAGAPGLVLALGALASGAAMMLGNTVWESTLQRHIPLESLSRVSAYDWFGSLAFRPLGLAIWGPVSAAVGISTSLWSAFACFVLMSAALLAVPDIRRLRAMPEPSGYPVSSTSSAGTSPQSVSSR
jgi:predicted MFS family arabinose efflux permease